MIKFINEVPRNIKKILIITFDFLILNFSTWLALSIRIEDFHIINKTNIILYLIPSFLIVLVFFFKGLYSSFFRYIDSFSITLIIRIFFFYSIISTIILFNFDLVFIEEIVPRSLGLIFSIIACSLILAERTFVSNIISMIAQNDTLIKKKNIIIYGVNDFSFKIIDFFIKNSKYNIVGIITDNRGIDKISSYPVYKKENIDEILNKYKVDQILVFNEDLNNEINIINDLSKFNIPLKKISKNDELFGENNFNIINFEVEDLINRQENQPDIFLMEKNVKNKSILVTGATGSIGKEISDKIIKLGPKKIFLLDNNEYELYLLKNQFQNIKNINTEYILADITDKNFIKFFFQKNKIDTIFHAAAYKHVPLLEGNIYSAVKNNILGTFNLSFYSQLSDVTNFVLISTDKAVKPSNIMGLTKRASELILLNIKKMNKFNNSDCKFTIVRFGNVLNSRGSALPLFKDQIQSGGPVTITDFRMRRYFMSISEASELVIQASSISKNDDIFFLDMGKEILIIDLIKKMILLKGLKYKSSNHLNGDIEIKEIGIRPGEKLSEELIYSDKFEKTINVKILKSLEDKPKLELVKFISELENLLASDNNENIKNYLEKNCLF
jgi:FlaA1/EpsC-like NDP-sugar epimerase